MTTEPTQPQPEQGPAPDNGQVQSQGHRRRRRRRKNKSSQQAANAGPAAASAGSAADAAVSAGTAALRRKPPPGPGRGRRRNSSRRTRLPQAQPGNSISALAGQAQGQAKGSAQFVGPMDHSYRAVNGNVADGPPSTIPTAGNGHGGSYYPDAYGAQPAAPVREDAPTRIFCFIEDLFFLAKIQETARKLGVKVEFVKGDKDAVARICDAPENERPALLVFDLNNLNAKPMALIPKFKSQVQEGRLDHRLPQSSAGRPEDEGPRGGMRHGDAALGLLAEPAQSCSAATAWKRKKSTRSSRRSKKQGIANRNRKSAPKWAPFLFSHAPFALLPTGYSLSLSRRPGDRRPPSRCRCRWSTVWPPSSPVFTTMR